MHIFPRSHDNQDDNCIKRKQFTSSAEQSLAKAASAAFPLRTHSVVDSLPKKASPASHAPSPLLAILPHLL